MSIEDYIRKELPKGTETSKDYKHLKELLDKGEKIVAFIQILPPGYRKYHTLATAGIHN